MKKLLGLTAKIIKANRIGIAKFCFIIFALLLLASAYMWASHSIPMLKGNYETASGSILAQKEYALYDAALLAYGNHDYEKSVKLLKEAFTESTDRKGEIPEWKEHFAAEVKFLTGLSHHKAEHPKQAIEAYKEALRLNPNHKYAKYNLELLLQPQDGAAQPQPQDGPAKADSPKGKI